MRRRLPPLFAWRLACRIVPKAPSISANPAFKCAAATGGDVNPATDANPPKTEHPGYGQ